MLLQSGATTELKHRRLRNRRMYNRPVFIPELWTIQRSSKICCLQRKSDESYGSKVELAEGS